ncbi:MAG: hypothetical protein IJP53_07445 [Synergistaceae bacterium]|nr:hypothetical protein [Synergistaceae bacterium]MBR0095383.1 hypothetical protein [Synergistaceae bacterium]
MENVYVYKNVFDAEVRRLDEKMDSTLARIEARMDAYMARMEARDAKIDGRLDAMDARISNLTWSVNLMLTIVGLVVAGVGLYLAIPH